ncbi:hypothetical protein GMLC_44220 [Geomonas limicola]|uniref:Uncharacterized protein n=1 Tax=Geomonas limicola TaxID=2740186 RepID=A0A6V8NGS6_9BACT|nr:hypothetical protein [Geomonas limicola]GFO70843.1 hypothetical protein GMLC_44220 [Geomonas limicola]
MSSRLEQLELLRSTARELRQADEFPTWLLSEFEAILEHPDRYTREAALLERLLAEIRDYDPYAGMGCFGGGTSTATIQATLREILQK